MKIIFIILLIIVALVVLVVFIGPILGIGAAILYVFKKSTEKKSSEFLQQEKLEMEQKVNSLKEDIDAWQNYSLADITNNIKYTFSRGLSNRIHGRILSRDGTPVIAFQRIDRGLYTNTRIVACSTDFKLYFEYTTAGNVIYYNDVCIGKINTNMQLVNANNQVIGKLNRNQAHIEKTGTANYTVQFNSGKSVNLYASYDRKVFLKNPFFKRVNAPTWMERQPKIAVEPGEPYSLVTENTDMNSEEIKWITAIATFEAVYYSFNFMT